MFILCHAAKNEPRKRAQAFPLGIPLVRAQTTLRETEHIQRLCWRFDKKSPTRKCYARCKRKNFCPLQRTTACTNFKQKRESNKFSQQRPHLGRAIYAPTMEDLFQSNSPAVHRQNGGTQGGPGGNVRASFLSPFLCDEAKKWHQMQSAQRATWSRCMSVRLHKNFRSERMIPHENHHPLHRHHRHRRRRL